MAKRKTQFRKQRVATSGHTERYAPEKHKSKKEVANETDENRPHRIKI